MREGAFSFYRVQHKILNEGWADSDLGHLVFRNMPFAEQKTQESNIIRDILRKESDLWQLMREYGFLNLGDALRSLGIVRKRNPVMTFRIVRIHQTKSIEPIIG